MTILLIKPSELPPAVSVGSGDDLVVDNGTTVASAKPKQVVDAGRPIASQQQAVEGVDNTTAMTPLRVAQAYTAQGEAFIQQAEAAAVKAQDWAESSGEPGDPGTKSAKGWAGEAEADRIQTGLDRVATGQDRVATGQDRVVTGQDRVQTGQDRTQTGLDRIATGQDRVATGQDKTDAQTARTQAQTAQGLAEDAQGFAEDAQAAAEAAFRDFDKRYLGPYPAAPTHDLNGDPVVTGALYFDTVIGALRVYDGSGWITVSTAGALLAAANLSDVDDVPTARTNLGLGTAATVDHGTAPGEVPLNSDLGSMATKAAADYVTKASKATQAQAEGGTTGDVWMDDIRVRQALIAQDATTGKEWNDMPIPALNAKTQNALDRALLIMITKAGSSTSVLHLSPDGAGDTSSWSTYARSNNTFPALTYIPAGWYFSISNSSPDVIRIMEA